MRKALVSLLLVLAMELAVVPASARKAPDFALSGPDGKQVSLSHYRGKLVVVEILSPT